MNVGYFVDKNNHVYEYAKGNLESNYTSLDMSKVESKPTYESLVNVQSNMVRFSIFSFNLNFFLLLRPIGDFGGGNFFGMNCF